MFEVQDPPVPDSVHGFQRIDTFNERKEMRASQDFVTIGPPERTTFREDTLSCPMASVTAP